MCIRCCSYDNYIDGGVGEHIIRGVVDLRVWVVLGRIVVWLRRALYDGMESELRSDENEGNMEDLRGHSAFMLAGGFNWMMEGGMYPYPITPTL